MTIKKIVLIIIALSFTALFSQNKRYTDYYLTAGADINLNMHISDFIKLSGIPNCCNGFKNTTDLGYNIFIGMDYMLDKNFLHGLKYSSQISVSNLSANFITNEFIGNDLLEDEYRPITVEHNLNASLLYLNIGQSLVVNPLDNIPLGVKFGFDVGFPIVADYEQYEKLLEPADVFFQGGGKERNKFSGKIPNAESFYFALKAGVRYSVFKSDSYEIVPQLEYAYSITNVTSAQDWAIDVLRAGIAIHYNIPKADLPKPQNPPSAKLIEPKISVDKGNLAVSNLKFFNQDKQEINVLKPIIVYNPKVKISKKDAMPLTFFYNKYNNDDNFAPVENLHINLIEKLKTLIQSNPTAKFEFVSYSPDETEIVQNKRIEFLKSNINSNNNISSRIVFLNKKQISRTEIEDEYRKIDVLVNNEKFAVFIDEQIVPAVISEKSESGNIFFSDINTELNYEMNLQNDNAITDYSIKVNDKTVNNLSKLKEISKGISSINGKIGTDLHKVNTYNFAYSIDDAEGLKSSAIIPINFVRKDTILTEKINYFDKNNNSNEAYQQFTIGYFDFDKSSFSYFDIDVVEKIKKLISENNKIEIISMTDNFGSEEYNTILAEKRAATTMKLLETTAENVLVTLKNGGLYNNDNPYSRILNRAVIIRIIK